MTFYPTDRLALFIDGANFHAAAKALAVDIDYRRLLDEFRQRGVLTRAYYYTALLETEEFSPLRPLVDWLDYNGFTMVTKAAREYTDREGRKRWRGDMDIEIAVDMLELAPRCDHMVLFSGDGDFRCLVEALQRKGVRVTVVSTLKSQPPMVSDDLRRQADAFIDLADLVELIGRPARERPPRVARDGTLLTRNRRATARSARASSRYRGDNAREHPDWFNAPVPSFGDPNARLLIVGLAPGRQGANRTGRPFTGDHAGVLLYDTLTRDRLRARPIRRTHRRRFGLGGLHDRQRGALRTAGQPPAAGRGSDLPPLPRRRHRRPAARAGDRNARGRRPPQPPEGARAPGRRRTGRPRRDGRSRRLSPDQQLSLLAPQHEHGPPHAGDVSRGVRDGARVSLSRRARQGAAGSEGPYAGAIAAWRM